MAAQLRRYLALVLGWGSTLSARSKVKNLYDRPYHPTHHAHFTLQRA